MNSRSSRTYASFWEGNRQKAAGSSHANLRQKAIYSPPHRGLWLPPQKEPHYPRERKSQTTPCTCTSTLSFAGREQNEDQNTACIRPRQQ